MEGTVVIAGGGMVGLEIALRLERKGFEVKLVEPREEMFFYPLAHRLVKGLPASEATISYDKKFEGRGIEHVKSEFEEVLPDEKVAVTSERDLEYDYLVLAYGVNYEGVWPSRSVDSTDPEQLEEFSKEDKGLRVLVVGGGATGVEMAAGLNENGFEVELVGSRDELLPDMPSKASRAAEKYLEASGVNLRLGRRVQDVSEDMEVTTDDGSFHVDRVLWAGGHRARELIRSSGEGREGLEVDRFNRASMEDVFAAGDCVSYPGKKDRAVHALVEAKTVSENIVRTEKDRSLKERNVRFEPTLIDVGNHKAILEFSGLTFSGLLPYLIESIGVEKRYMLMRKHLL